MYYFVTVIEKASREIVATYLDAFESDAHERAQTIGTIEGYAVFITSGDPLS
jgi:predicted thioesterase